MCAVEVASPRPSLKQLLVGNIKPETMWFILKLGALFTVTITLLAILHDQVYQYGKYPDSWLGMAFNMNGEHNIPTWFASIAWFCVSLGAMVCFSIEGRLGRSKTRFWWLVIAAAFLIASCDDVATIHEHVGLFLQNHVDHSWLRQHVHQTAEDSPWLMFYIAPLAIFGTVSALFIWNRFKSYPIFILLCLLGGASYALALACEQYQGQSQWQCCQVARMVHIPTRQLLNFSVVLEESMEMMGSTLLIMSFAGFAFEKGVPLAKSGSLSDFSSLEQERHD